jgi:PKD repeat protein
MKSNLYILCKKNLDRLLFTFSLLVASLASNAQTNLALTATADAFGNAQAPWNWMNINNNVISACGNQEAFVWTAGPPDPSDWMSWVWPTTIHTNRITIHHAQTTGRFLTGGIIQRWDGSAWVNHFTFSNLNQANCENDINFPTVSTTRIRITAFQMGTGQNSNPNFREIEIWSAPPPAGSGPILPPIANFFPGQATTTTTPVDTVWINSPYELVSTSTNTSRAFWDIPGENPLLPGYVRNNVAWTAQQYIDTAKYDGRFKYTYNRRGFWPIRLLAVNNLKRDSMRDSIVKYIYVDTPGLKPNANFFSSKRIVGVGDYTTLVDLSTGGPNQWLWSADPFCNLCNVPPYFNNFFGGPADQNPLFFAGDPGKYTVCLQVWNARGDDTTCLQNYIEVVNSINVCSGSAVSSNLEKGFLYGPSGPTFSYTRSQLTGCQGFLLNPCADSVIMYIERLKMLPVNTAPPFTSGTDTLVFHNGTSASAPIIAKIGGTSLNNVPSAIRLNGVRGGSRVFVRIQTNGAAGNPANGLYDTAGFSIRWEIKPPSYPKPRAIMEVQDTIYSMQPVLFKSTSVGTLMQYAWDSDGNNIYDSTAASFTRTFLITTPQFRKVCLIAYNCVGFDTVCKNVLFSPISNSPIARMGVDKVQGFNTDTFRFRDMSLNGPSQWRWTFTPGTAQYLLGTNATSKDPVVRFTQRTKYTVKLVVTNSLGKDSVTNIDYINIGAYDNPACLQPITLADGSIGISRVSLTGGIDTTASPTSPCYQMVLGNQAANLYRGSKAVLSVSRPGTSSPMDRLVWIDSNMDGLFSSSELVMNEMGAQNLTKVDTVTVSTTQPLGTTRMRIGVTYAGTQLNPSVTFLGLFKDFTVNYPMDTVRPSVSLRGGSTVFTEINKPYNDSGIVAIDNIEGNISTKYQIIGSVDNSKVGPNYLKYIVKDLYGNTSDTLYRTVMVILNQTGPSLQLAGPTQMYVEVYNKFIEPGYTASDNNGNSLTNQVIITSTIDTAKLGQYTITYTILDAFGLSATASRTVTVGDTTKPTITPISNPYAHQVGTAIDLLKVVDVRDNYWKKSDIVITVQGIVNVNQVGSYFVTYLARDNSGNLSPLEVVRVDVKDIKAPDIRMLGANPHIWSVKVPYVDPGVDPSDNFYPKNTLVTTKKGTVNVNVIGDYTIWYIVSDPSNNMDSVSRLVQVRDITAPVVNLLGFNQVNLPRWQVYVDPPVSIEDNFDSDAAIRAAGGLVITNKLPLNSDKKPFGDAPGLYDVEYVATDLSGNVSAKAIRTINVLPEGPASVSEVMNIDNIMSIYPNPSNGVLNLRLVNKLDGNVNVSVLDMLGKTIFNTQIKGNVLQPQEIDFGTQATGFYLLKIENADKVYVKKIQVN